MVGKACDFSSSRAHPASRTVAKERIWLCTEIAFLQRDHQLRCQRWAQSWAQRRTADLNDSWILRCGGVRGHVRMGADHEHNNLGHDCGETDLCSRIKEKLRFLILYGLRWTVPFCLWIKCLLNFSFMKRDPILFCCKMNTMERATGSFLFCIYIHIIGKM